MLQKNNYSTVVQIICAVCKYYPFYGMYLGRKLPQKLLKYLLKCSDLALEENAMAWVVWVSQGCMDFKSVVRNTEDSWTEAYLKKNSE